MKKTKSPVPKPTNQPPSGIRATGGPILNIEDDSAPPAPAGDLKKVSEMARQMIRMEEEIADIQERLTKKQKELECVQCADLPSLMETFGLKEFTLTDGSKIVVMPITKASLPSESAIEKQKDADKRAELRDRFERGMTYLESNGAGALIKNFVEAELGKDSKKQAVKAIALLKTIGITAEVFRGVHPGTLTSWVKERLEAGASVDFDLLGVYTGQKAEIKTNKPKKAKPEAKSSLF